MPHIRLDYCEEKRVEELNNNSYLLIVCLDFDAYIFIKKLIQHV